MKTHTPSPIMAFAVLTLVTLQFLTSTAAAQSSWTGATDGAWGTAGNWDPSGVPANDAALTFGAATTYDVNLGGVTRTIGASTFSEDYTFTNGTLASGATWTGTAGKTVSIDGVLSNTAARTIDSGDWVLSGNTAGSRLTLSGATLRLTGSGINTSQLYLQNGATAVYDKSFTTGLGTQVLSFQGGSGGTLRSLTGLNLQPTVSVNSANAVVANDSGTLVNFGGSIQFSPNTRLSLISTNGGFVRFDNWIGLDRVATSSITIVTDALTTNTVTAGRGIRDSATAGAQLRLIKGGTNDFVNVVNTVNTYTGGTVISDGALVVERMDQLGNSSAAATNLVFNGGNLRYAATTNETSTRGFQVTGDSAINGINVSDAAVTLTMSGTNTGSGTFNKLGAGRLALTGDGSARTGTNVVQAGSLIVDGSLGGTTIVNSGTVLGGSGALGSATISGTHAPGNSPGIQTFTGDLSYNAANVQWELTANTTAQGSPTPVFDQIVVGGNLDFATPTTLSLSFNSTGSTVDWTDALWSNNISGTSGWLLYDVAGTLSNLGSFSIATENWADANGALFNTALSGSSFSLYQDGSDIYLNYAIPEPSTYALLVLAAAGLGAHVIRRRRQS